MMTATLDDVTNRKKPAKNTAEADAARELVRLAREQGLSLTGPRGPRRQLTKTVIETALNKEITEHLGYAKNDAAGQGGRVPQRARRGRAAVRDGPQAPPRRLGLWPGCAPLSMRPAPWPGTGRMSLATGTR